jgi:hypothetical protein
MKENYEGETNKIGGKNLSVVSWKPSVSKKREGLDILISDAKKKN